MIYKITHCSKEEYLEAIKKAGQTIIDSAESMLVDFKNDNYNIKEIEVSFIVEPMKIQDIQVKKTYITKYQEEDNVNE